MSKLIIDQSSWTVYQDSVRDSIDGSIQVTVEFADVMDRNGAYHWDGAWRVRLNGKHVKTFKGETAWSDAQRLADDIYRKELHK